MIARKKPSESTIRISAKNLGELALPQCCPRCIWIKLKLGHRLPFQVFPGIFSNIDAYTKDIVNAYFDAHQCPPPWLAPLGDIVGFIEPPHWTSFNYYCKEHDILLRGSTAAIFVRRDGATVIVDFKTAKFTETQDELLPMYVTQLNVYALILEKQNLSPVAGLALVYTEPATDPFGGLIRLCCDGGFSLGFTAHVVPVDLSIRRLDPLLARVRELCSLSAPPAGRDGCHDCTRMDALINAGRRRRPVPAPNPR